MLVSLFPAQSLGLFTQDQTVIAEGLKYLNIVKYTYLIFALTNLLLCSLRSVETVKLGFIVSVFALVVNVSLNYILIFGRFGAPRLGIEGAAIATLLARIVELCVVIFYLIFIDKKLKMKLKNFFVFDKQLCLDYFKTSYPVIISAIIWGIAQSAQSAILGHLGATVIAAASIATTVFQVLTVAAYGSANATAVIVGKTIGEGRYDDVKQYAKTLQILYVFIGLFTSALLFSTRKLILGFYSISPETYDMAMGFILVLCVTSIGTSYQIASLTGIVRGAGDTKFVLFNDTIFMWVIVLPISYIAAFWLNLNPIIVFACLKSDQVLKCFVALIKVNRGNWIKVLTR